MYEDDVQQVHVDLCNEQILVVWGIEGIILPSFVGIIINPDKDTIQTTSMGKEGVVNELNRSGPTFFEGLIFN